MSSLVAAFALLSLHPFLTAAEPAATAPHPIPAVTWRVVEGSDAQPGAFPGLVAIFSGGQFCHGALISRHAVLTAAHCLNAAPRDMQVWRGGLNISNPEEFQRMRVTRYVQHPFFDQNFDRIPRTFGVRTANDIAVVFLRDRAPSDAPLLKIGKDTELERDGATTVTAGWGVAFPDVFPHILSPILQQISLTLQNLAVCQNEYFEFYQGVNIGTGVLCATDPDGVADVCAGDSGAPLMARNEAGELRVIGIVSQGDHLCRDRVPGIYTQASAYTCWLKSLGISNVGTDIDPCDAEKKIPGPVPGFNEENPVTPPECAEIVEDEVREYAAVAGRCSNFQIRFTISNMKRRCRTNNNRNLCSGLENEECVRKVAAVAKRMVDDNCV